MPKHISIISLFVPYPYQNTNVFSLAAALKKNKLPYSLIFHHRKRFNSYAYTPNAALTEKEIKLILKQLDLLGADIAGLSVYSKDVYAATQLTRAIREKIGIPVIWGGVHPTISPEECIQQADIICRGEGDEAIVDLLQHLSAGKEPHGIENLWFNSKGHIARNRLRPPAPDLDSLGIAAMDEENMHFICTGFKRWRPRPPYVYTIGVSRGCLFSCSYCVEPILRKAHEPNLYTYRFRSPENVVEELKKAKQKYDVKYVAFREAMFPHRNEWIEAFCSLYKQEIKLPFSIFSRPATLNQKTISLLVDAGLRNIYLGLESGSERIRRQILNRGETNAQHLQLQNYISEYKEVTARYFFIIDNPFEKKEDLDESLDLLLNLPGKISLIIYSLIYYPKLNLTERAISEGFISKHHLIRATMTDAKSLFVNCDRNKTQQLWCAIVILVSFYLYWRVPSKRLIYAIYHNRLIRNNPYIFFIFSIFAYKILYKISTCFSELTIYPKRCWRVLTRHACHILWRLCVKKKNGPT